MKQNLQNRIRIKTDLEFIKHNSNLFKFLFIKIKKRKRKNRKQNRITKIGKTKKRIS